MRARPQDRRRFIATKIIGFILIGESIALPAWALIHGATHNDRREPVRVTVCTVNEVNAVDIVPITIYDGPVPVPMVEPMKPTAR